MLVQYTAVSFLDNAARNRLMAVAGALLHTNEAQQGYVIFEGKTFSVLEVRALAQRPPQFLTEA